MRQPTQVQVTRWLHSSPSGGGAARGPSAQRLHRDRARIRTRPERDLYFFAPPIELPVGPTLDGLVRRLADQADADRRPTHPGTALAAERAMDAQPVEVLKRIGVVWVSVGVPAQGHRAGRPLDGLEALRSGWRPRKGLWIEPIARVRCDVALENDTPDAGRCGGGARGR